MAEEVTWDEAFTGGKYVKLETDEPKVVHIKDWKLMKEEKFGEQVVEFQAVCTEEDGETVDKMFCSSSKRLKTKLRPLTEKADKEKGINLSIIRVGEKYDTQYSVKEVKE